ncbi:MAG TPA: GtrA family protein [Negativicutes bacterium]|jgi:dolichol-phosphate mannosyltransferase
MVSELVYKCKGQRQLLQYILIGCTGVTWDVIGFIILTKFLALPYLIANATSVSLGITNNFLLNAFYNFKMRDRLFNRFIRFYCIGLMGLLVSSGLMFVLVNTIVIDQFAAKLTTVVIVALLQFYFNKTITFGDVEHTNGYIIHSNTRI